jgi:hypothetical protein
VSSGTPASSTPVSAMPLTSSAPSWPSVPSGHEQVSLVRARSSSYINPSSRIPSVLAADSDPHRPHRLARAPCLPCPASTAPGSRLLSPPPAPSIPSFTLSPLSQNRLVQLPHMPHQSARHNPRSHGRQTQRQLLSLWSHSSLS